MPILKFLKKQLLVLLAIAAISFSVNDRFRAKRKQNFSHLLLVRAARADSSGTTKSSISSPHRGSLLVDRDTSQWSKTDNNVAAEASKNVSQGTTPERSKRLDEKGSRISKAPSKHISDNCSTAKKAEASPTGSRRTFISISKNTSKGGREVTTILRLKREYRDAVRMGIAYDWVRQCTIVSEKKKNIQKRTKTTPQQASQTIQTCRVPPDFYSGKENFETSENKLGTSTKEFIEASRTASSSPSKRDTTMRHVLLGPLGTNLRIWHFSIRGPTGQNSPYTTGVYHGRVILPKDYPGSPPRVHILTPNGRFVPGLDICLSASSYHPESWTPQWTIQALLQSLRLHFLTEVNEIGGMHASPSQRRFLAMQSRGWRCELPSSMNPTKSRVIIDHPQMLAKGDLGYEPENNEASIQRQHEKKKYNYQEAKSLNREETNTSTKNDVAMKQNDSVVTSAKTIAVRMTSSDSLREESKEYSDDWEEEEEEAIQLFSHLAAKQALRNSLRRQLLLEKAVTVLGIIVWFILFKLILSVFGTGFIAK